MRTRDQRGLIGTLLILVIVVVAAGGFAVYWYVVRDDAPAKVTITERSTVQPTSGASGTYHVVQGPTTFAGFRVKEHFGPLNHTAVARSSQVTGTMTLAGTTVSKATVKVDLRALQNKDDQPPGVRDIGNRIGFLQHSGLEMSTFPTTTFTLTKPIVLPTAPKVGEAVNVSATGTLALHGVTKAVTIPLTARWNGAVVDVVGSLDIPMADFRIDPPSLGFVHTDANGTLEFELQLAK